MESFDTRRTRKAVKIQRAIVGATLEDVSDSEHYLAAKELQLIYIVIISTA